MQIPRWLIWSSREKAEEPTVEGVTVLFERNGEVYREEEVRSDPMDALEWGCREARIPEGERLEGAHTVAVLGKGGDVIVSVSVRV